MKTMKTMIYVEVCYGTAKKQHLESFLLEDDSTLKDAVLKAFPALQKSFPELSFDLITPDSLQFGVFSQPKELNYPLKNNDRVEIYRPLLIDPMQKKQLRQAQQAQQGIKKIPR